MTIEQLKEEIDAEVNTNGRRLITGAKMNKVLKDTVDTLLGSVCYMVDIDYVNPRLADEEYDKLAKAAVKMAHCYIQNQDRIFILSAENENVINMTHPVPIQIDAEHQSIFTIVVVKSSHDGYHDAGINGTVVNP